MAVPFHSVLRDGGLVTVTPALRPDRSLFGPVRSAPSMHLVGLEYLG